MWRFGRITCLNHVVHNNSSGANNFSTCCPPKKPSGCGPGKVIGKSIPPPGKCGCRPRVAPNPCRPIFHDDGKDTWKKYRNLTFFVCIPIIIAQAMNALSHGPPHKGPCRDYEYMRVRNKRYPWGTGKETFFHNEHVNHLPGECELPPPDCD